MNDQRRSNKHAITVSVRVCGGTGSSVSPKDWRFDRSRHFPPSLGDLIYSQVSDDNTTEQQQKNNNIKCLALCTVKNYGGANLRALTSHHRGGIIRRLLHSGQNPFFFFYPSSSPLVSLKSLLRMLYIFTEQLKIMLLNVKNKKISFQCIALKLSSS